AARDRGRVRWTRLLARALPARGAHRFRREGGALARHPPLAVGEVRVPGGSLGRHHDDAQAPRPDPRRAARARLPARPDARDGRRRPRARRRVARGIRRRPARVRRYAAHRHDLLDAPRPRARQPARGGLALRRRGAAGRAGGRADAREPCRARHPRALRRRYAMNPPRLTVRAIRATPVEVPMRHVLGTSQAAVRAAPLLLVDLETEEGVTGRAYLFCYVAAAAAGIVGILAEVERAMKGERLAPLDAWKKLARRFTLIGVQGIVRMSMSAFDVAAWDAIAIAHGVPLAQLLGAAPRPVRAYNSNGLGLMELGPLADEAPELLEGGFEGVKLRLGYPTLAEDLAAIGAVRARIGDGIALMVDYNQALSVAEAIERGRRLDREGLCWIEEPIRHDDYRGAAKLAR